MDSPRPASILLAVMATLPSPSGSLPCRLSMFHNFHEPGGGLVPGGRLY